MAAQILVAMVDFLMPGDDRSLGLPTRITAEFCLDCADTINEFPDV